MTHNKVLTLHCTIDERDAKLLCEALTLVKFENQILLVNLITIALAFAPKLTACKFTDTDLSAHT